MQLKALILFGSCARGDQQEDSDVDMLAIHDDKIYRIDEYGKLNFSLYSETTLSKMMSDGELFALHLATESKIIYENDECASKLFKTFRYKNSYQSVIDEANILAWTIIKHYYCINKPELCNKRLVWCVRTICAAMAAEQKKNCFSAASIIASVPLDNMAWMLKQKSNVARSPQLLVQMREFLQFYNLKPSEQVALSNDIDTCVNLFKRGSMGYKFIHSLITQKKLGYL
ncbi:MAG: nucleotidyltransferase domain-containing protein [Lentisphaeria bacterium]|nr:nucleotidyltransferase domain-containing protein [Lentisphaeria bacterium]